MGITICILLGILILLQTAGLWLRIRDLRPNLLRHTPQPDIEPAGPWIEPEGPGSEKSVQEITADPETDTQDQGGVKYL